MNILYLGIVLSYFGIILLIGTFLRGAAKTSESYLIAGRSMGIVLCTATIAGEWLGGMSTIGTSELAMTSGFFPMWYNVSTAVGIMVTPKAVNTALSLQTEMRGDRVHGARGLGAWGAG